MSIDYKRRWETRSAGRSVSDESRTDYYNVPVIHKPHWKWLIICYFFLGGVSSASYVIASIAELFGGREGRRIARVGRYLSFATLLPSPILLILDLGRPERFFMMLRVVKLRSPMSLGTWALTIFGAFAGVSTLIEAAEDGLFGRFRLLNRLLLALPRSTINVLGSIVGFFVGGYTGVLLGVTAVPLWAKNVLLLGPLFLASAMSTGSAAITLLLSMLRGTNRQAVQRLEHLHTIALIGELGLIAAARVNTGSVIARPIREGRLGHVFRWGVVGAGLVVPLALQLQSVARRRPLGRSASIVSSSLTLTGGFLLRYVMVMAGRASADDPAATFEFARKR